jgi:molybdopterin molybdotransferase
MSGAGMRSHMAQHLPLPFSTEHICGANGNAAALDQRSGETRVAQTQWRSNFRVMVPVANSAARRLDADVRQLGFSTRTTLATALSWVERHARVLAAETIPVSCAPHRVLAAPVGSRIDRPDADRAARDGYAVLAADTEAADPYTPLLLRLTDGSAWRQGEAITIASGAAMPAGTDAVLPFELAARQSGVHQSGARHGGALVVTTPAAPGAWVRRRGSETQAGREVLPAGRWLRAGDAAFLAGLGVKEVDVVRRPGVVVVVIGPKSGDADLLGPILLARIGRDGGCGASAPIGDDLPATLTAASAGADLVIVAGRSGSGADDDAAPGLLAAGGTLDLHGVALQPGESAGLGRLGAAMVLLLPGDPLACLATYEMLAARAVRRLGGVSESELLPMVPLDRKIVSPIGVVELVFVRLRDRRAIPLASDSLALLYTDGYVVVPETSEGFAAGCLVALHPLDPGTWSGSP